MEYIIILITCVITILVLKFALNIKLKDLKEIKEIGYSKQLNEITNKLPQNKEVCEEILKMLNNKTTKIEISQDENSKLSYYMVLTNNIIIANINNTFTRIQTIAHECIHSVQNKKMLMFNFIYSNIYILYFLVISILTILKIINTPIIWLIILILLSLIYYAVRSYLETDAMTNAPYIAKEYIQKNNKLSEQELQTIMENYKKLNQRGIPATNFGLIVSAITKIIIYCAVSAIMVII